MTEISVIVPVYNVEKYVKRCLKSIINQSFKEFELIVVDDGSTDKSSKIVSAVIKDDKRCKLYRKKNGGLSSARNFGLKVSEGKYIVFIDSDDFVEENFLSELYDTITKTGSDVALCLYNLVDENGRLLRKEQSSIPDKQVISGKELLKSSLQEKFTATSVVAWNKIYKASLFQNVKFSEGKTNEDQLILMPLFWNVTKVAIVDQSEHLYNYVQRDNSIMNSAIDENRILSEKNFHTARLKFYKKKECDELYFMAVERYKSCIRTMTDPDIWNCLSSATKSNLSSIYKKLQKEYSGDNIKHRLSGALYYLLGLNNMYKIRKIRKHIGQ